MGFSAEDRHEIARVAQQIVGESVRNLARGTGGAAFPLPVHRSAMVVSNAQPGGDTSVVVDGDVGADDDIFEVSVPATNATGEPLYTGDRVLVLWVPPHGIYVTNVFTRFGEGVYSPALTGASAVSTNQVRYGRYSVRGRTVRAWCQYQLGAATSWGSAPSISVPFRVRQYADGGSVPIVGKGHLFDASTSTRYPLRWIVASGQITGQVWYEPVFSAPGPSFLAALTTTAPVTQASGDYLVLDIEYETDEVPS